LCTICTAVAPEAVFTRRTNDPTRRGYPPTSTRLVTTLKNKPAGQRPAKSMITA
jgi:hypothetical protein